jgi:hypothetical protein
MRLNIICAACRVVANVNGRKGRRDKGLEGYLRELRTASRCELAERLTFTVGRVDIVGSYVSRYGTLV